LKIDTFDKMNSFLKEHDSSLRQLCLHYLMTEKRVNGKAIDPVANFHLGNGAELFRVLSFAHSDLLNESFGMMVNYHYNLSKLAVNSHDYMMHGSVKTSESLHSK
jgi:malonyl-CoA decarboxylase